MAPSLRRSSRRAAASAEVSPAPPAAKRRRRASPSPNPDAKAKAARKTEPEAAREPGDAVPGQDGMVYGFDGAPTSSYEFEREQRMRANAAFLDSLGLGDAKAGLAALAAPAAKKTGPSRRGIKAKREKAKPLPRRKSSRIRGEAADGLQIDTEVAGRVSVSVRAGADPAVAHARAAALKAEVVEAAAPPRVADGPLTLSSTTASEVGSAASPALALASNLDRSLNLNLNLTVIQCHPASTGVRRGVPDHAEAPLGGGGGGRRRRRRFAGAARRHGRR
mmetsp:Transcript_38682/g.121179  ORF Transcript_38682/g.121179 Transcript_38682/m.121179 type:complete len:278 (-) Transcript_38682:1166-1999(-)